MMSKQIITAGRLLLLKSQKLPLRTKVHPIDDHHIIWNGALRVQSPLKLETPIFSSPPGLSLLT